MQIYSQVRVGGLRTAADGDSVRKNNSGDALHKALPVKEIVKRALSLLGQSSYNAMANNCEHLVNYCRYGISWSRQVAKAVLTPVVAMIPGVGLPLAAAIATSSKRHP